MTVPHTHYSPRENENLTDTTVNVDPLTELATAADPDLRGHTVDSGRVPSARADASMKAPPRSIVLGHASEGTHGRAFESVGDRPPLRRSLSDDRKLVVGSLGVLLAVFALVSSNVAANHSPKPHGLPIGIVGSAAVVDVARAGLARAAPGAF